MKAIYSFDSDRLHVYAVYLCEWVGVCVCQCLQHMTSLFDEFWHTHV